MKAVAIDARGNLYIFFFFGDVEPWEAAPAIKRYAKKSSWVVLKRWRRIRLVKKGKRGKHKLVAVLNENGTVNLIKTNLGLFELSSKARELGTAWTLVRKVRTIYAKPYTSVLNTPVLYRSMHMFPRH